MMFLNWIKRNWKWILGISGIFIISLIAVFILKNKKLVEILKTKMRLFNAEKSIAYLEGQKKIVNQNINSVDEDVKLIDMKLDNLKSNVNEDVARIKKLSPDAKLERFERLGY